MLSFELRACFYDSLQFCMTKDDISTSRPSDGIADEGPAYQLVFVDIQLLAFALLLLALTY